MAAPMLYKGSRQCARAGIAATALAWAVAVVAGAAVGRSFEHCSVFGADESRREFVLAGV